MASTYVKIEDPDEAFALLGTGLLYFYTPITDEYHKSHIRPRECLKMELRKDYKTHPERYYVLVEE